MVKLGALSATPSVDCLMVTLPVPERLPLAKRSIDDFCRQTHERKRLLLILNGGEDAVQEALRAHVAALGRSDIKVVTPPGVLNISELRNVSLDESDADLVCQWDDDDLYHPRRVEAQAAHLTENGCEAVYLQDVMQYFPSAGTMYWTNWRATAAAGHPGTLMARRSEALRYPTQDRATPEGGWGEDSVLADALIARGQVGYLEGMAHLYVYVSHGANSFNDAHHTMLAKELSISQGLLKRREAQIREGLAPFGFPVDGVTVSGMNGTAFTL